MLILNLVQYYNKKCIPILQTGQSFFSALMILAHDSHKHKCLQGYSNTFAIPKQIIQVVAVLIYHFEIFICVIYFFTLDFGYPNVHLYRLLQANSFHHLSIYAFNFIILKMFTSRISLIIFIFINSLLSSNTNSHK